MFLKKIFILKNLLKLKLIFGLYSDCSSSKIIRLFAKLYCILYNVVILVVHLYFFPDNFADLTITSLLRMCTNILFSLCYKEKYMINLHSDISTIDKIIKFDSSKNKFSASTFTFLFILIIKYISIYAFKYESNVFVVFVIVYLVNTTNYLSHLNSNIIFDLFHIRLKFIRENIVMKLNDKHLNVEDKLRTIKKFINVYKTLLDSVDAAIPGVRIMVPTSDSNINAFSHTNIRIRCFKLLFTLLSFYLRT